MFVIVWLGLAFELVLGSARVPIFQHQIPGQVADLPFLLGKLSLDAVFDNFHQEVLQNGIVAEKQPVKLPVTWQETLWPSLYT